MLTYRLVDILLTGERLTDVDVDTILKLTGTEEDLDGNIKYEGLFSCHSITPQPPWPHLITDDGLE